MNASTYRPLSEVALLEKVRAALDLVARGFALPADLAEHLVAQLGEVFGLD